MAVVPPPVPGPGLRIGIDLGGTKVELVALDRGGEVLVRQRRATPRGEYEATVELIAAMVREAEREIGATATVGIGIPGAISAATGLVKNANSTCLIGKPLRQDIEACLGREVRMTNDANCFALSEAVDGAGAGAAVVFGVILGTGVGGGIVAHGRVITGANAIAGEWGHNPLPLPAAEDPPSSGMAALPLPACYCGRMGCIETYLSGPGMVRDHVVAGGTALEPAQIAERAAKADAACEATLQRYEQRLARSLAQVINILDPDVIVLGGGVSNLERLYRNVPRLWTPHVFSDLIATRLERNRHGDSGGVRGAAWLWP